MSPTNGYVVLENALLAHLQRSRRLESPRQAERFLWLRLAGLQHEELHAVWLDGHHRVIDCDVLAKGAVDRAQIDPRVVVQCALQRNARYAILAHNHPSGVAEASAEDVRWTRQVREALGMFEVELLVHYVLGDGTVAVAG
jgi:DNA repair protein RadC